MTLFLWLLHTPRYLLAHILGHCALFAQWVSVSIRGLADGFMEVSRYLYDLGDEDEGPYDVPDETDGDDDEGLAP